MLDHDAAIHDDADAACFGAGGGFRIDDSQLNPQVFQPQLEHLVDDGGNILGRRKTLTMSGLRGRSESVA